VILTIDTEMSARPYPWSSPEAVAAELDREVYGVTSRGEVGIRYQADVLRSYGLRAVFFVESLCADVVGLDPLRRVVDDIQSRGQEVQLHVHSEWLEHMGSSPLPGKRGYNLRLFSQDEQAVLITRGLENLRKAGAAPIRCFRAGNFGGNFSTLRALSGCGIEFDTTWNPFTAHGNCDMPTNEFLLQPTRLHGVYEFPLAFFSDRRAHYRALQLCACSLDEMKAVTSEAWERGWHSLVVLSHSFDLLRGRNTSGQPCFPSLILKRRFEAFCRFLAENSDKFQTTTFSEISSETIPTPIKQEPLASPVWRTAWRMREQLLTRFL